MKPTYAGIAATAALVGTLAMGFQESKGNTEGAGDQLTTAQIEAELTAMKVLNKTETDEKGTAFFDLTVDGVSVQMFVIPSTAGTPAYWRLQGGWNLLSKPRLDDVNKFNMSTRQAFAYLDNQYDPFLVVDQNVASGSTVGMLRGAVESYRDAVPSFKSVVLHNRS